MPSPLLGTEALPTSIEVGGTLWPIRHDFRDGIRFETMVFDVSIPETTKVVLALDIWFEDMPHGVDMAALIDAMLDFYRCGKPPADGESDSEQVFSYEHDWDAIYAGFLTTFHLDLLDPDTKLHWWKFRSMLIALPAESALMRIIGYRTAKTSRHMSAGERAHIRRMQRIHALPHVGQQRSIRTREDLDAALAAVREAKERVS